MPGHRIVSEICGFRLQFRRQQPEVTLRMPCRIFRLFHQIVPVVADCAPVHQRHRVDDLLKKSMGLLFVADGAGGDRRFVGVPRFPGPGLPAVFQEPPDHIFVSQIHLMIVESENIVIRGFVFQQLPGIPGIGGNRGGQVDAGQSSALNLQAGIDGLGRIVGGLEHLEILPGSEIAVGPEIRLVPDLQRIEPVTPARGESAHILLPRIEVRHGPILLFRHQRLPLLRDRPARSAEQQQRHFHVIPLQTFDHGILHVIIGMPFAPFDSGPASGAAYHAGPAESGGARPDFSLLIRKTLRVFADAEDESPDRTVDRSCRSHIAETEFPLLFAVGVHPEIVQPVCGGSGKRNDLFRPGSNFPIVSARTQFVSVRCGDFPFRLSPPDDGIAVFQPDTEF